MPLLPFILKLQKSWGGDYEASNDLMAGQGTAEREGLRCGTWLEKLLEKLLEKNKNSI